MISSASEINYLLFKSRNGENVVPKNVVLHQFRLKTQGYKNSWCQFDTQNKCAQKLRVRWMLMYLRFALRHRHIDHDSSSCFAYLNAGVLTQHPKRIEFSRCAQTLTDSTRTSPCYKTMNALVSHMCVKNLTAAPVSVAQFSRLFLVEGWRQNSCQYQPSSKNTTDLANQCRASFTMLQTGPR